MSSKDSQQPHESDVDSPSFSDYMSQWQAQLGTFSELFRTEAKLSMNALLIALGITLAIAVTALLVLLLLITGLCFALYHFTQSLPLTFASAGICFVILLFWLVAQLKAALAHIGFNRTTELAHAHIKSEEKPDASESATPNS